MPAKRYGVGKQLARIVDGEEDISAWSDEKLGKFMARYTDKRSGNSQPPKMIPTRILAEMGRRNFRKVIAYGQMQSLDIAHVLASMALDRTGYTPVAVRQKAAAEFLKLFIPQQHMVAVAAQMEVVDAPKKKWEVDMERLSAVVNTTRSTDDVAIERIYQAATALGHDPKELFKVYMEQGDDVPAPTEFVDAEVIDG